MICEELFGIFEERNLKRINNFFKKRMAGKDMANYINEIPWVGGQYRGQLKYGVPEGLGKLVMPDGSIYEGEWLKGKPHGKGTIYYTSGGIYKGEIKDSKRNGFGIYTRADGKVYKGLWENNRFIKAAE